MGRYGLLVGICVTVPREQVSPMHVSLLKRKVSWLLGAKEYHKVTLHNKPHKRDILGKTEEGGYHCWCEKQQRMKQVTGLYRVS